MARIPLTVPTGISLPGVAFTSLAQYTRFSSYGHGQGLADMQITPDGWGGNLFNAFTRTSDQQKHRRPINLPARRGTDSTN